MRSVFRAGCYRASYNPTMVDSLGQPIKGLVSNWHMFPKHLCFQNTCTWSGPNSDFQAQKFVLSETTLWKNGMPVFEFVLLEDQRTYACQMIFFFVSDFSIYIKVHIYLYYMYIWYSVKRTAKKSFWRLLRHNIFRYWIGGDWSA